jgi:hypothetical protein
MYILPTDPTTTVSFFDVTNNVTNGDSNYEKTPDYDE